MAFWKVHFLYRKQDSEKESQFWLRSYLSLTIAILISENDSTQYSVKLILGEFSKSLIHFINYSFLLWTDRNFQGNSKNVPDKRVRGEIAAFLVHFWLKTFSNQPFLNLKIIFLLFQIKVSFALDRFCFLEFGRPRVDAVCDEQGQIRICPIGKMRLQHGPVALFGQTRLK